MKHFLIILFLHCLGTACLAQMVPKTVEIKGAGISIQLPDTSFSFTKYEDGDEGPEYISKRFKAMIGLGIKNASDPRSFEDIVKLWKLEMNSPGVKIEIDTALIVHGMPARVFKVKMMSNLHGKVQGVWWHGIYSFNGKPLSLMGGYEINEDITLSPAFLETFLSLTPVNTDSLNAIFQHRFSIDTNQSPLKFAGYFLDGYILSINGRGPNSMQETHCVVVSYNNILLANDDVINELHVKRLLIHDTKGERIKKAFAAGTRTAQNKTVRYFYDAVEVKEKNKIIFLGIVADRYGYFEIWGEAYGDNRNDFIPIFKKIAESIKRDGD